MRQFDLRGATCQKDGFSAKLSAQMSSNFLWMIWLISVMNTTIIVILACITAYLIGSIPFGLLVARAKGINIRQVGSGNIGATNIARNLGWKLGALVGVLDFSKSFLPILLARSLFTQDSLALLISIDQRIFDQKMKQPADCDISNH